MPEPGDPARRLPHAAPPVIPATDLGGVTVLKWGGVFLLTDPFGDVVPDSRGLGCTSPTRVGMMACLVLLVGGERPSVLQPDPGGADRDNASPERPLARRSLGITRERRLDGGLRDRRAVGGHPRLTLPAGPTTVVRPAPCRFPLDACTGHEIMRVTNAG